MVFVRLHFNETQNYIKRDISQIDCGYIGFDPFKKDLLFNEVKSLGVLYE